tara:strand:+ start:157 stop:537 length:381 start_codon:yes stop_codon:yes gene_type:complete
MKPDVQRILTKLATQKVEFGIMQETKKAINKHTSQRKKLDGGIERWYSDLFSVRDRFSKLEAEFREFNSSVKSLEGYTKEIESMAKELGVSSNSIDGYNEAKAYINTSQDVLDEYKEAKKLESKIG